MKLSGLSVNMPALTVASYGDVAERPGHWLGFVPPEARESVASAVRVPPGAP